MIAQAPNETLQHRLSSSHVIETLTLRVIPYSPGPIACHKK